MFQTTNQILWFSYGFHDMFPWYGRIKVVSSPPTLQAAGMFLKLSSTEDPTWPFETLWETSTVSGWWLTYPSEKYESQMGWWHSQYMEKNMFQTTNQVW